MNSEMIMKLVDAYADSVTQRTIVRRVNARAAVVAAIDALTKDAGRYQWLRHGDNDDQIIYRGTYATYLPRNEQLDQAIDAAIAASEEQS